MFLLNKPSRALILGTIAALSGCAEDIGDALVTDAGMAMADGSWVPQVDADVPLEDAFRHTNAGMGVTETRVSAISSDEWHFFDIDTGEGLEAPADPFAAGGDWDLAIQRFHLRMNGGEGGAGSVAVAMLADAEFDSVSQAPAEGYLQDLADGDDDDELPDFIISAGEDPWWSYNPMFHTLSPKERVYVLRSSAGAYFAIEMVDYYDADSGDSGYPSFRWKAIDAPEAAEGRMGDEQ